jgi:tetratricopeptide (TPR) repeat protein
VADRWDLVDDYGLLHLADHLAGQADDPEFRDELYRLISASFMREKQRRFGSNRAFADDVVHLIDTARAKEPVDIAEEMRGCLVAATLSSLVTPLPPGTLELLVRAGDDGRALALAEMISDPARRSDAYRTIGERLLGQADVDAARAAVRLALSAASSVEDSDDAARRGLRAESVAGVVPLLVAVGEADQARDAVEAAERAASSPAPLRSVARALAELGDADRATKVAAEIGDEEVRAEALCDVAAVLVRHGDKSRAIELVRQAEATVRSVFEPAWRVRVLASAAEVLAAAGRRKQAADLRIRSFADISEIDDAHEQTVELTRLAYDAARLREPKAALEVVARITDHEGRIVALAEVAAGHAGSTPAAAVEVGEEALAHVDVLEQGWRRRSVRSRLAEAFARAGELDRALAIVEESADWFGSAQALTNIGSALIERGDAAAAGTVAEQALDVLLHATADDWAHEEDVEISIGTLEGLSPPGASPDWLEDDPDDWGPSTIQAVLARVLDSSASVREESRRARALVGVGVVLADAGLAERALEIADEAVGGVRVEDSGERDIALRVMAVALARVGDVDRARSVVDRLADVERVAGLEEIAAQQGSEPPKVRRQRRRRGPPSAKTGGPAPAISGGLDDAVREALSRGDGRERAAALGCLATDLSDAGRHQEALDVGDLAISEVRGAPLLAVGTSTLLRVCLALAEAGELEDAGRVVAAITEPAPRAEALAKVAAAEARAGRDDLALATVERARAALENVSDDTRGATSLALLPALVAVGDVKRAQALAESMEEDDRLRARTVMALALAERGDHRRALRLVELIGERDNGEALIGVTRVVVRARRWSTLRSLVESARPYWSDRARVVVVEALAGSADMRQAVALADEVGDNDFAVEAFAALALGFTAAGKQAKATEVAQRALAVTEPDFAAGYALVAHAFAAVGDRQAALAAVKQAQAALRPNDYDDFAVAKTQGQIACALARLGQKRRAVAAARRALAAAGAVLSHDRTPVPQVLGALGAVDTEDSWVGPPLRAAARAVVAAGMVEEALPSPDTTPGDEFDRWHGQQVGLAMSLALAADGQVVEAIEVAGGLAAEHRVDALSLLSRMLARSGQAEAAQTAAQRCLTVAEGGGLAGWRAAIAGEIAVVAARAGETERARALLAEVDDSYWLFDAVPAVARAAAERGDDDVALAIVALAEDEGSRASALGLVAEALAAGGRTATAVDVAEEALQVADEAATGSDRVDVLVRAAGALQRAERRDRALVAASRAVAVIREEFDEDERPSALDAVGLALAYPSVVSSGVEVVRAEVESARWRSREAVFSALRDGAEPLAVLDGGVTLGKVCEAVADVEEWWSDA